MNEEIATVNTGRYSIGEEIYGICFQFESRNASTTNPAVFLMNGHAVSAVMFNKFTVTEHHKVHYHFGDVNDKTCDGYSLVDENGIIYHNQYPSAHYEQMSDTNDRLFKISTENYSEDMIDNLLNNVLVTPYKYSNIQEIVDTIHRIGYSKQTQQNNSVISRKYRSLWIMIDLEFRKKYPGKKIIITPVEWIDNDGNITTKEHITNAVVVSL